MRKFRWFCLGALFFGPLSGCIPVVDVVLLVAVLPGANEMEKVDLSDYSLGPISSDGAQELVLGAVPAIEEEVYFTGRAQWSGLRNIKQPTSQTSQSIVAFTDFEILFIWWREPDEQYLILMRLPYSDIYSVDLRTPFLGTFITLCLEGNEVLIADQVISIDRKTNFNFINSSRVDAEKTKAAFQLLNKKVIPKEELENLPSACEEEDVVVPGFGEADITGQP